MELIIDANIVISALISWNGRTRDVIFLSNVSLFAPEYLLEETEKYRDIIIKKSKLDVASFELAKSLIFSKITLIPFSEFESHILEAKEICPDPNDEEYFALALSKDIPVWTDDKMLKRQSDIEIISTTELINSLSLM
jgi:predicted nucleic acid-binding protein